MISEANASIRQGKR